MKLFKKRWLSIILLLAFVWHFVMLSSFTRSTLKQMVDAPFALLYFLLSPDEASAKSAPKPCDYMVNRIPGGFIDISAGE